MSNRAQVSCSYPLAGDHLVAPGGKNRPFKALFLGHQLSILRVLTQSIRGHHPGRFALSCLMLALQIRPWLGLPAEDQRCVCRRAAPCNRRKCRAVACEVFHSRTPKNLQVGLQCNISMLVLLCRLQSILGVGGKAKGCLACHLAFIDWYYACKLPEIFGQKRALHGAVKLA